LEFRDALDVTIDRISDYAPAYAAGERGLRRALVTRFPYAVYFRVEGNTVVVVGVIHGKRHPRAWKAR
jgi:plasmid stabilization system protein ParE